MEDYNIMRNEIQYANKVLLFRFEKNDLNFK